MGCIEKSPKPVNFVPCSREKASWRTHCWCVLWPCWRGHPILWSDGTCSDSWPGPAHTSSTLHGSEKHQTNNQLFKKQTNKQQQWSFTNDVTLRVETWLHQLTCLRNSSRAISPWATRRTSFTTISFFWRSTSQICPRVSSDRTQFTCRRFISCFQWRSLSASDFSSITNMLI